MNSKWRKTEARARRRETFDARPILASLGGVDFGPAPIACIHLSTMGRKKDCYYDAESILTII